MMMTGHALLNGLLYQRAYFPDLATDAMNLKALQSLVNARAKK